MFQIPGLHTEFLTLYELGLVKGPGLKCLRALSAQTEILHFIFIRLE